MSHTGILYGAPGHTLVSTMGVAVHTLVCATRGTGSLICVIQDAKGTKENVNIRHHHRHHNVMNPGARSGAELEGRQPLRQVVPFLPASVSPRYMSRLSEGAPLLSTTDKEAITISISPTAPVAVTVCCFLTVHGISTLLLICVFPGSQVDIMWLCLPPDHTVMLP